MYRIHVSDHCEKTIEGEYSIHSASVILVSASKQNPTARAESENNNVSSSYCYSMNRIESNHDDDAQIYNYEVGYSAYMRRNQAQDQELNQRLRDLENRQKFHYSSLNTTTTSSSIPSSFIPNETSIMCQWMNEKNKQVMTFKNQIMEQQMALLEKEIQLAMLHEKLLTQERRMQEELNMMKELSQMENDMETSHELESQNHDIAIQTSQMDKDNWEGIQDLSEGGGIAEIKGSNLQSAWNQERQSNKTLNVNEAFPDPNVKIQPTDIIASTCECNCECECEAKQAPNALLKENDWDIIECEDIFTEVSDEQSNLSQSSHFESKDELNVDDSWDIIEGEEILNTLLQNKKKR